MAAGSGSYRFIGAPQGTWHITADHVTLPWRPVTHSHVTSGVRYMASYSHKLSVHAPSNVKASFPPISSTLCESSLMDSVGGFITLAISKTPTLSVGGFCSQRTQLLLKITALTEVEGSLDKSIHQLVSLFPRYQHFYVHVAANKQQMLSIKVVLVSLLDI